MHTIDPKRYEYIPVHKMPPEFNQDFYTSTHYTDTGLLYVWRKIGTGHYNACCHAVSSDTPNQITHNTF